MIDWIRQDYRAHKVRMILELMGMILALSVSLLLALTTPNPPMLYAYIGWMLSAMLLGGCSWHRGSLGLTVTYLGFLVIDGCGLMHTLWRM